MLVRGAALVLLSSLLLGSAPPAPSPCPWCKGAAAEEAALKGVWLSVESPVNPTDGANRGVFLLVHTYWLRTPASMDVRGRAEGVVDGQRRSVALTFQDRGDGVYALSQSWPSQGRWALAITGRNRGQEATAVVRLSDAGQVAGVEVSPDGRVAEAAMAALLR